MRTTVDFELNYDGIWRIDKVLGYDSGKVYKIEDYDMDKISFFDIKGLFIENDLDKDVKLFFLEIPEGFYHEKYGSIESDLDIMKLLDLIKIYDLAVIKLYSVSDESLKFYCQCLQVCFSEIREEGFNVQNNVDEDNNDLIPDVIFLLQSAEEERVGDGADGNRDAEEEIVEDVADGNGAVAEEIVSNGSNENGATEEENPSFGDEIDVNGAPQEDTDESVDEYEDSDDAEVDSLGTEIDELSDIDLSFLDDDDFQIFRRERRQNRYAKDNLIRHIQVGMTFKDMKEAREAVNMYSICNGFGLKVKKADKSRTRYVCEQGCPFFLLISKDSQGSGVKVKTINEVHECLRCYDNPRATKDFIANYLRQMVQEDPSINIEKMQKKVGDDLNINVSEAKCKRAKRIILKTMKGGYKEEFKIIESYIEELKRSNPGSSIFLELDRGELQNGNRIFKRLFIMFKACKEGWKSGCRPILGLDGAFLKGPYNGQLLVAVGQDGNNHMYPVAWAIVSKENKMNWSWFIRILRNDLEIGEGESFTIMSDMQKGLIPAVKEILPQSDHRWCARHIYSNWCRNWRGDEMKKNFWICAWSTYHEEFADNLKVLGGIQKKAAEDLLTYNPENWCRAYFSFTSKSASVDNNIVESFNSWILKARHKPVIRMLEEIRIKIMCRIAKLALQCSKWDKEWSPACLKVYKDNRDIAHMCRVEFNGANGYEVSEGVDRHTIKLDLYTCTCREWDLTGIPCPHALTAMNHSKLDPMKYISHYYSKQTCMEIYKHKLEPVRGQQFWSVDDFEPIEPPPHVKQAGRPKKQRNREMNEPRKVGSVQKMSTRDFKQRCSNCKEFGHKRKKCKKDTHSSSAPNEGITPPLATEDHPQTNQLHTQSSQRSEVLNERIYVRNKKGSQGYGYFYDPEVGTATYHQGDEIGLYIDGDDEGIMHQDIEPDVNTRFPIPSELETRIAKRKANNRGATGERSIAFGLSNIRGPANLPFKPTGRKRNEKSKTIATQDDLAKEQEDMLRKKRAKQTVRTDT